MAFTPTDVASTPSAAPAADSAGPAPHGVHAVTELLRAWSAGDAGASDALVPLVYTELRRQARRALSSRIAANAALLLSPAASCRA